MKLTKQDYTNLRDLMDDPRWLMTMQRIMQDRVQGWIEDWRRPMSERRQQLSDEEIKGRVNALVEIMKFPALMVKQYDRRLEEEKKRKEHEEREAQRNRVVAAVGRNGPHARPPISDDAATPGPERGEE